MKIVRVLPTASNAPQGAGQLTLRPGQTLAAIVLKGAKPGGTALLSVAGGQLQVKTRAGLQAGEALELRVEKTGQQLVLSRQTHDPKQNAIDRLSRALADRLGRTNLPQTATRPLPQSATSGTSTTATGNTTATPPGGTGGTPHPATTPTGSPPAGARQTTQPAAQTQGAQPAPQGATRAVSISVNPTASAPQANAARPSTLPANTATQATAQATSTQHAARTRSDALPEQVRTDLPRSEHLQHPKGVQHWFRHSGLFAERSLIDKSIANALAQGQIASRGRGGRDPAAALATTMLTPLTTTQPGAVPPLPMVDLKFLLRRAARNLTDAQTARGADPTSTPTSTRTPTPGATRSGSHPTGGQQSASQASQHTGSTSSASSAQTARASAGHQAQAQLLDTLNARLDAGQLRTALHQVQGQGLWIMDMPILHQDQLQRLQMAIREEESGAQTDSEHPWQVDIAIDLPGLGPLHASLHLRGDTLIDVRLYADGEGARRELNRDMDRLETGLQRAGLEPGQLAIYPGPPPKAVQERLTPPPPASTQTWRA